MKILVIDDIQEQLAWAIKALEGNEVITVSTPRDAERLILSQKFDLVLTDLMMPYKHDDYVPFGFALALLSVKQGFPTAIVSDTNHHRHPVLMTCDKIFGEIVPEKLWVFAGRLCPHMDEERLPDIDEPYRIKDWKAVYEITSDPTKFDKYYQIYNGHFFWKLGEQSGSC